MLLTDSTTPDNAALSDPRMTASGKHAAFAGICSWLLFYRHHYSGIYKNALSNSGVFIPKGRILQASRTKPAKTPRQLLLKNAQQQRWSSFLFR
jgi:hypothetical protein